MSEEARESGYAGVLRARKESAGLEVAETEYGAGLVVAAHVHDNPLSVLVLEGGMTEERGGRRIPCGAGSLIYHPSHEVHAHRFHAAGGRCLVVQFHTPWTERMRELGLEPCAAPVDPKKSRAPWLAAQIRRELIAEDAASGLAMEGYALMMLAEIARDRRLRERGARPGWLIRAMELLHDRVGEDVDMAEIAAEVGIHPVHLSRTFHAYHGTTMGEYVRRLRVERARHELVHSEKPLAMIALDAGFADQAHFTRVFKSVVGQPPGAFRRAERAT